MRPKKLTETVLTDIALTIAGNQQLRPGEMDKLLSTKFKISPALARQAKAALKTRAGQVMPTTAVAAPPPQGHIGTPVLDKMPTDPLTARQTIIDSLYDQMQNAMRPDDRIKAGKELARMLGYHREDVQDEMRGATRNQEDEATKCKRIANALRKALGLPEVIDAPQRDVPAIPAKLDSGSEPAAAVLEG